MKETLGRVCYFISLIKIRKVPIVNSNYSKNLLFVSLFCRFFSSTFRHNICTNDWVAFHGKQMLKKPYQFSETKKIDKSQTPMWDEKCPFCFNAEFHNSNKLLTLRISDLYSLPLGKIMPSVLYSPQEFSSSSSPNFNLPATGATSNSSSILSCDTHLRTNTNKTDNLGETITKSSTFDDNLKVCEKQRKLESEKFSSICDYALHVIQNKYPVVLPSECIMLSSDYGADFRFEEPIKECSKLIKLFSTTDVKGGVHGSIPATGFHEIIVDFPFHYKPMKTCDKNYWHLLFTAFRNRGRVLAKVPLIQSILFFKNSGVFGGGSVVHPHSQLVALPIVSQQQEKLLSHAMHYFEKYNKCLFCEYISIERDINTRIIQETDSYIAMVPYAAHIPYHINIFPKKHNHQFLDINDEELNELALILSIVFYKIDCLFEDPDYNLVIRSAHFFKGKWRLYKPEIFYHWYIEIFPRFHGWPVAGFEFGSGIMANSNLPEDDAEAYRKCKKMD